MNFDTSYHVQTRISLSCSIAPCCIQLSWQVLRFTAQCRTCGSCRSGENVDESIYKNFTCMNNEDIYTPKWQKKSPWSYLRPCKTWIVLHALIRSTQQRSVLDTFTNRSAHRKIRVSGKVTIQSQTIMSFLCFALQSIPMSQIGDSDNFPISWIDFISVPWDMRPRSISTTCVLRT